jgi:uncharacterized protein YbcI
MQNSSLNVAQQIAQAACAFQQQSTGHAPKAVTVVLSADTLVVTLHEALTPVEKELAKDPAGAAQVQEFHRQLFAASCDSLQQKIRRITGVEVREAAAEVETATGTVIHAFTTGAVVQVFLLAQSVRPEAGSEEDSRDTRAVPAIARRDPAPAAPRLVLRSRNPRTRLEPLQSAPPGYRELSIPAASRGPFTDQSKTLVFKLTCNERPSTIAVTANEKGQLVHAYVGGALAKLVSERVLLAKKKKAQELENPSRIDRSREPERAQDEAVKTLGENVADMRCAASAVVKTILESLDVVW